MLKMPKLDGGQFGTPGTLIFFNKPEVKSVSICSFKRSILFESTSW